MKQLKVRRPSKFVKLIPFAVILGVLVLVGATAFMLLRFRDDPAWQTYKVGNLVFSYPPDWIASRVQGKPVITVYNKINNKSDQFSINITLIDPYSSTKDGEPRSLIPVSLAKNVGALPVSFNGQRGFLKFFDTGQKPNLFVHAVLSTSVVNTIQPFFTPDNQGIVMIDGGYVLDDFTGNGKVFDNLPKAVADPNYQTFKKIIESMHFR